MPSHKKSQHKKKHHASESTSRHEEAVDSDLRVETSNPQEKDSSSENNNGQSVNHAASSDEADAFASANSTPRHPSGLASREGSVSPRSMSPRIAGL